MCDGNDFGLREGEGRRERGDHPLRVMPTTPSFSDEDFHVVFWEATLSGFGILLYIHTCICLDKKAPYTNLLPFPSPLS